MYSTVNVKKKIPKILKFYEKKNIPKIFRNIFGIFFKTISFEIPVFRCKINFHNKFS